MNHFIMDETKDYSFTPPDRRLQDLDFFLPDYNESETPRLNVLFMVDISASLKDQEVDMAAAEICAAIEQFGGMLSGSIGFFDSEVRRVVPITSAENLLHLTPYSGGGTSFQCIFDYNHIDAIIGLPANIFFGTGIPTIIMVLRQKRENTDVLIIDASKGFIKEGKNNKLRASDIKRITVTFIKRESVSKFSRVVSREEIRSNDYNLNIPRYVDRQVCASRRSTVPWRFSRSRRCSTNASSGPQ